MKSPESVSGKENKSKLFVNLDGSNREINYKGLRALLPNGYPEDLLSYTDDDFYNIAMNATDKPFYKVKHINGKTLSEIIKDVYTKYPSFNSFDAKAYQKLFPKLSPEEILANSEDILDYTEKVMAFDIASAFSQLKGVEYTIKDWSSNASARTITGTNSDSYDDWKQGACAAGVVSAHPRIDVDGVHLSVDHAKTQSGKYPSTASSYQGSQDNIDAYRHGIWGVYIGKFGTWRYSDSGKARGIIADLLNCHEQGNDESMDSRMDFSNNTIALNYYSSHVDQTGSWPDRNTTIHESVEKVVSDISAYPMVVVSTTNDFNSVPSGTLVRIR